jgi:hypothetical protein
MLKRLLIILVVILIVSEGRSQTSKSDTVCFPISDALKVLEKGKEAQVLEKRVANLKSVLDSIQLRITFKDSIINTLKEKDAINSSIISGYKVVEKTLIEQRDAYSAQLTSTEKQLKKQKRRKKFVAFAGLVTTTAAIIVPLLIK